MRTRTLALAVTSAVLGLTLAPEALAHSASRPSPRVGDSGTIFKFKGGAWQPGRRIRADYFRRETDDDPFSQTRFSASGKGRFRFRLTDPWFFDAGNVQKVCFTQFDTRPQFGRRFTKCRRLYVEPAHAYFMPSDGQRGDLFVLVAHGFETGRTLRILLTTPLGAVQTYSMTTRTRGGYVSGGPQGRFFIPRGGASRLFQSNPNDPLGLYTAFIIDPDPQSEAQARTALFLRPG